MTNRVVSACRAAFSLVELSIVLVILGLLTGGILSGQSLIRASELRAVTTEYQRYNTAVQSFRDKYFAIPGDFNNATTFWGATGGTGCANNSGTVVTTPGTCDGDGDGTVDGYPVLSQSAESFQFWRQLALAGLVEGTYTGITGSTGPLYAVPGTNVPKSKMSNGGWGVFAYADWPGDSFSFANTVGNVLLFGSPKGSNQPQTANLKPEEAWNIDTKLDDGKPGTGKVLAYNRTTCTSATAAAVPNVATTAAATYTLSSTAVACSLWFANAF